MTYPRELLDSAIELYQVLPQTEATLRRAISTAYYALFHFLIEEACRNWGRPDQRHRLARRFEHGVMASSSRQVVDKYKKASGGSSEQRLHSVALAFTQLQERRLRADYDLARPISGTDIAVDIWLAEEAFATWPLISHEPIAQDYLFALLFKDRT